MDLVDPRLGSDFNKEEVLAMINIALLSTKVSPAVRPAMSSVVSMLEGRTAVQDIVSDPSVPSDDLKLKEMKEHYYYTQEKSMGVSESVPDRPWTASSPWILNIERTEIKCWFSILLCSSLTPFM